MRSARDESEQKVIDDIAKFGWHCVNVLEDETHAPHAFSIGLYETFKHPEVIIIGLDARLMYSMLAAIAKNLREGQVIPPGGPYVGLLQGVNCCLVNAEKEHYREYVGFARWYYDNDDFPLQQCVWPTKEGIFPWQNGAPKNFVAWQKVLGKYAAA